MKDTLKITDLRSFLQILEEQGQVRYINKEVNWQYELGSVMATFDRQDKGAVVFNKVKDREFRVAGIEVASRAEAVAGLLRLDRNLALLFLTIAGAGGLGWRCRALWTCRTW